LANVPAQVKYGKVLGQFVGMWADGPDVGEVPDERPLSGMVTITPNVTSVRWPTTTPPRTAIVETVRCPVIDGVLCGPDSTDPGVWLLASAQPNGEPDHIQWTATFDFDGILERLPALVFEVPAGGVIDLASVVPAASMPGTVKVVSSEDRLLAEQAAQAASASAQDAARKASDAAAAAQAATATNASTLASLASFTKGDKGDPGPPLAEGTLGIKLGSKTSSSTPYVDFLSSGGTEDYSARIAGSGGTKGTNGKGRIVVTATGADLPSDTRIPSKSPNKNSDELLNSRDIAQAYNRSKTVYVSTLDGTDSVDGSVGRSRTNGVKTLTAALNSVALGGGLTLYVNKSNTPPPGNASGTGTLAAYNAATTYNAGDWCTNDGYTWEAAKTVTGSTPNWTTSDWVFVRATQNNIYGGTEYPAWMNNTPYATGAIVVSDNITWYCLQAHTSNGDDRIRKAPTVASRLAVETAFWTPIGLHTPVTAGLDFSNYTYIQLTSSDNQAIIFTSRFRCIGGRHSLDQPVSVSCGTAPIEFVNCLANTHRIQAQTSSNARSVSVYRSKVHTSDLKIGSLLLEQNGSLSTTGQINIALHQAAQNEGIYAMSSHVRCLAVTAYKDVAEGTESAAVRARYNSTIQVSTVTGSGFRRLLDADYYNSQIRAGSNLTYQKGAYTGTETNQVLYAMLGSTITYAGTLTMPDGYSVSTGTGGQIIAPNNKAIPTITLTGNVTATPTNQWHRQSGLATFTIAFTMASARGANETVELHLGTLPAGYRPLSHQWTSGTSGSVIKINNDGTIYLVANPIPITAGQQLTFGGCYHYTP